MLLQTVDLNLCIGQRVLVQALDWSVQPGQCWCVIGRNGAGKSTLLRTLTGMREPDAGVVRVQNRALRDWPLLDLARQRALLPQGRSDAFGYSVIESVLTARHPYHAAGYWESKADYQAAYRALQDMDASALAERDIRTLSGGERQRVAIAAVLAQDTPLLLLDEPGGALDLGHQVSMMALLARLCSEAGKAVVMVSHDLNLAHCVATHALLLMGDGEWHAGPVAEVMQAPVLSRFLGHPVEVVLHGGRSIYLPALERKPEMRLATNGESAS